jgi:hypothetical protein
VQLELQGAGAPLELTVGEERRCDRKILILPDLERADRIGEYWSYPQSRAFAELLIGCEEDRTLRAVLVGMLREAERGR